MKYRNHEGEHSIYDEMRFQVISVKRLWVVVWTMIMRRNLMDLVSWIEESAAKNVQQQVFWRERIQFSVQDTTMRKIIASTKVSTNKTGRKS